MDFDKTDETQNYKEEDIALAFELISDSDNLESRMSEYVNHVARGYNYRYYTARANLFSAFSIYRMLHEEQEMAHLTPEQVCEGCDKALKELNLQEEKSLPGGLSYLKETANIIIYAHSRMFQDPKKHKANRTKANRIKQFLRILANPKYTDLIAENPYFAYIFEEAKHNMGKTMAACIRDTSRSYVRSGRVRLDTRSRAKLIEIMDKDGNT